MSGTLERSNEAEAAIAANLQELDTLLSSSASSMPAAAEKVDASLKQYETILQSCDQLRLKLVPRAKALQMLHSDMVRPGLLCAGQIELLPGAAMIPKLLIAYCSCKKSRWLVDVQAVEQKRLIVAAAGRDTPLADTSVPSAELKGKTAAAKPGKAVTAPAAEPLDPALNAPADATVLLESADKALQAAKGIAKAKSDAFYSKRDAARALTRPGELPDTQAALLERIGNELDLLRTQVQEHVAKAQDKLHLQVSLQTLPP